MRRWINLLIVIVLLHSTFLFASELNLTADEYTFTDTEQAQRFDQLSRTFRCLVCQNQTLADSNAPLAQDLRRHLYEMVQTGEDNAAIIDYFTTRYGDFVLYRPPFRADTLLLWFGPILLLIVGVVVIYRTVKKQSQVQS